ncbi:hypothetical protein ACGFXC_36985 [Streptomyces sp. NPDC048507]|uniref:hypothetical protein n=1 Tax=Streptomyces sp. NPDC048507 TaxID=3365560 RepID=UPI0037111347
MTAATVYGTGTSYSLLAALLPARARLLLSDGAPALSAEVFTDPDTAGALPVVSVWSPGFDADVDGPGLDALLARLDAFGAHLRRMRHLLLP